MSREGGWRLWIWQILFWIVTLKTMIGHVDKLITHTEFKVFVIREYGSTLYVGMAQPLIHAYKS